MVNGINRSYWMDWDLFNAEQEFREQKEKEYFDYVLSGQRTIDVYGEEGAKEVLRLQAKRDKRNQFNHKSRGK